MKSFNFFLGFILLFGVAASQTPSILWEKTFGGSDDDKGNDVIINSTGNYDIIGQTLSNDGDLSILNGGDSWYLCLDSQGLIKKNICTGGADITVGNSLDNSQSEGIVACGTTLAYDLNRFHGSAFNIHYDIVIYKLDSSGTLKWLNCYGSYGDDYGIQIKSCLDSGYIFISEVELGGFDVQGFHGVTDWWITKIDSIGQIQWSRCMGGSYFDHVKGVTVLPSGGYLVTGINGSSDGDVTCSDISKSLRVVKLDLQGNIVWDNCYGNGGVFAGDILATSDGGFVVGASASSNGGDVSGLFGVQNFWFFKADSLGQIQWSGCYGGTRVDELLSLSQTSDGGFLLSGASNSNLSHSPMNKDALIVKIDSIGNQEWLTYLGGSDDDVANGAIETADHDVVMVGYTKSSDGDVSFNHGMKDLWVVKLGASVNIAEQQQPFGSFAGKLHEDKATLQFVSSISTSITISFFDLSGREFKSVNQNSIIGKNQFEIPISLSKGAYIIKVASSKGMLSKLVMAE
jgi:hypothetical protein